MEEFDVDIRGLRLRVCAWGPPEGPVVLCLHGLLDQGATWARVAERLALQGYRVLAPDARGHGRSGHVGPGGYYHFPDYVADLDGLVRALELTDPTLVGHSMGGTVSCWYAAARPETVRRLVILEGLGPPALPDERAVERMDLFLKGVARPPVNKTFATVEDAAARMIRMLPGLDDAWAAELATRVLDPVEGGLRWTWDPLHRTRAPSTFPSERFIGVLGQVTAATTLVYGDRSWYRFGDLARREAALPNAVARLTLSASHALTIDVPELVAGIIHEAAQ